jgi:hypothetical protein
MENDILSGFVSSGRLEAAVDRFDKEVANGSDPWEIHFSLFPVVQKVLNPPFINPHLPKMYAICREFVPHLEPPDVTNLVRLEIAEYTRRPKLADLPQEQFMPAPPHFEDIERAIASGDRKKTAALMASYSIHNGMEQFSRKMLLLGSDYLDQSLGHSISCTAFILLELLARKDPDPWPVLASLADYFCKGHFFATPLLEKKAELPPDQLEYQLLRATSGRGIVNLHHTITIYTIDRIRHLVDEVEYAYIVGRWITFMHDKEIDDSATDQTGGRSLADYGSFHETFSKLDTDVVLKNVIGAIDSKQSTSSIKRYLVKAVCDLYQGDYNPHYLTGLGAVFWLLDKYPNRKTIITKGLFQYLDFFFNDLRSTD